jgi:hypothetical protein
MATPKSKTCLASALLFLAGTLQGPAQIKGETAPKAIAPKPETFHWETGPGWFGERIKLPPSFSPTMDWKGIEEIRFAPGMFKADQPDFFSYALVFSLEPEADVSLAGLSKQILLYYQGLSSRVSAGKGRKVDVSKFTIELKPAKDLPGSAPKQAKAPAAYLATLKWIEPFATGKPQDLHLEIHAWKDKTRKRTYLFFCASPQSSEAPIRKTLRKIRAAFVAK